MQGVILVVAMGGIAGAIITLAQSASAVPEHFSDHISFIQNIANIGAAKKFSAVQIQFLLPLVDAVPCRKDLLRQVSEETSMVHTTFLQRVTHWYQNRS